MTRFHFVEYYVRFYFNFPEIVKTIDVAMFCNIFVHIFLCVFKYSFMCIYWLVILTVIVVLIIYKKKEKKIIAEIVLIRLLYYVLDRSSYDPIFKRIFEC